MKKTVTFPDSGKTATFEVPSIKALGRKAFRKHPVPKPPVQEVNYGGGDVRMELNWAHPDYRQSLLNYDLFVDRWAGEQVINAIQVKLTPEQKQEVSQWKVENPRLWDARDSDADLWLENIAIATDRDYEIYEGLIPRPTQEGTREVQDSFQGDVSRP